VRATTSLVNEAYLRLIGVNRVPELPESPDRDLVALSDALTGLETFDARMSQVVELRFFGGLTVTETAQVLNVSPETVMRDWRTKAWLLREIRRGQPTASS
jgi:DNA-directed RNA polymerase specialized sigma24 family protein